MVPEAEAGPLYGMVLPIRISLSPAETGSVTSGPAIKATISAVATLGRLAARSQRTGAQASGHRTSNAWHTTSIMVRMVVPRFVQIVVHFWRALLRTT